MASELRRREPFIYRRRDDTLHWVLGDVVPPAIADAISLDDRDSAEERERLLYVACTRAMDLLILPTFSVPRANSWAQLLDLGQDDVPEWDPLRFYPRPLAVSRRGHKPPERGGVFPRTGGSRSRVSTDPLGATERERRRSPRRPRGPRRQC